METKERKDAIESAYCIFHQKLRVYAFSGSESQKDEIEYAVAAYAMGMDRKLYRKLSDGKDGFLLDHGTFMQDLEHAVSSLETMMG